MSRLKRLDIAIIGMACRFPGAGDLFAYWENIVAGVDATSDVPTDRWDSADFFDPTSTTNDRIADPRGGYLSAPIPFDLASHGILPNAVDGGEPEQSLVLDAARAALLDAGLADEVLDGRRVEMVIGRGNDLNRGNLTRLQHGRIVAQTLAILVALNPGWSEADREAVRADLKASLPPISPATVSGQLTNVKAGRVASRLDLLGVSYVVDAASASSLVALDLGARALVSRRTDLALVGGVYLEADLDFPVIFRQLGAHSRSSQARPFAENADGMLSGEGVGMVVLKRRGDAERDGNRIYAVLQGVGIASDGRELGQIAPSAKDHARAIRRAYRSSGIDPSTIGLIEGQGLGIPAADRAELRALRAVFPPVAKGRRVLGAVSSMIGHAMPAAGIAGLIKVALSLHHRILPPTLHAERPHPLLDRSDSPFTLNHATRPWIQGDPATPRRAGVNSFGFAGINAHAILEEHPTSADADDSPGALLHWNCEAVLLSADDRMGLVDRAQSLLRWLEVGSSASLKDLASTINTGPNQGRCRLGLVATSRDDLAERLRAALVKLADPACRSIRDARGSYFWHRDDNAKAPRLAFLFPGEGSQYPGMMADLCPHFPELRALFDTSDRIARESGATSWPSEHLFAPRDPTDSALWSAEVAVNVVLSAQWGMYRLLTKLGLKADAVIGHSSGELLALAAAGVLAVDRTFEDKLGELGAIFGRLETSGLLPTARLVAVAAPRAKVESLLGDERGRVEVAMDNCPHQVVIAGEPQEVERVVARLKVGGFLTEALPFSRAYHTPSFAPALGPIAAFFAAMPMERPAVPIYSCASQGRMPDDPAGIRRLAIDQWTRTVGFRQAVEAMHADGIDVLVDVGARGNLAGFVEDTLRSRPAFAIAANLPRRSGLLQLNHVVASLFARGIDLDVRYLYARRRPEWVDFEAIPNPTSSLPSIAIGFPAMTLSPALVERLLGQTANLNGRAQEPRFSESSDEGPSEVPLTNGFHKPSPAESPAVALDTRCLVLADSSRFSIGEVSSGEEIDATVLDFQATMAEFLRTQQAVMDAYLVPGSAVGEEFEFHLPAPSSTHAPDAGGPWAGSLVSLVEGVEAVSTLILDAEGDPVAEHHTLGGRRISSVHPEWRGLPVLPFAVMAEILAEAATRLRPGLRVVAFREVRAHRWIRYEAGPIALEIRAQVEPDAPSSIRVAIHNRGPVGAMGPLEAPVFEGFVAFGEVSPTGPIAPTFEIERARECRFTPESIYREQWLFHGPALQAVVGIGPIGSSGIEGTLRVRPLALLLRDCKDASAMRTDPIVFDNFTHLLGGWGLDELADDGDVIFPLRMGELAIFGDSPNVGEDVSCRIAIREVERHRVLADADLVRADGSTWMTIRGWEDWRFHWPGRYRDGFRLPDRTLLGEPLDLPAKLKGHASAVWLEPPTDMGRPVWRDVLEHVQLGPDERSAYLALPGPDSRRTHRLWGRIAAKEAARRLWLDRGGEPVYPADLIVDRNPLGRPHLRSRLGHNRLPSISIAHADGVAVALASLDASGSVGIDIESIVPRSATFEATAFLLGEIALLGDRSGDDRAEWVARLWCAKEAVAKATGLGFVEGPSGAEVVEGDESGSLGVRLRGSLATACPSLAGRVVLVTTTRRGDYVWAWTLGEGTGR